jgi:hypothetical protein
MSIQSQIILVMIYHFVLRGGIRCSKNKFVKIKHLYNYVFPKLCKAQRI